MLDILCGCFMKKIPVSSRWILRKNKRFLSGLKHYWCSIGYQHNNNEQHNWTSTTTTKIQIRATVYLFIDYCIRGISIFIHWLLYSGNSIFIHWLLYSGNSIFIHWLLYSGNSIFIHWLLYSGKYSSIHIYMYIYIFLNFMCFYWSYWTGLMSKSDDITE
jgi:hypothetical protein